ncbi:hypothetical protein ABT160_35375 [Streptomyces sp. NPDC001941]|uniref:hypothetical protein n=1 Tax=Streptomyces sp. NPDC001941 TaxID=3154659 RepID=UPI003328490E
MADETDVLLELWKGQREEARQLEAQRAALTNIVIVMAGAALGFLAQQGGLQLSSLGVTVPMFVLGGFGAVASAKYAERWVVHAGLADAFRREVGLRHPGLDLDAVVAANRVERQALFPRVHRIKIWLLWVLLHSAVSLGGLLLSAWILARHT